jgi:hypothetical protein
LKLSYQKAGPLIWLCLLPIPYPEDWDQIEKEKEGMLVQKLRCQSTLYTNQRLLALTNDRNSYQAFS